MNDYALKWAHTWKKGEGSRDDYTARYLANAQCSAGFTSPQLDERACVVLDGVDRLATARDWLRHER